MVQSVLASAERFVGRRRELRLVQTLFTAAAEGRGSLAVVSGEPGIGKTRFCDEVATLADGAGLNVVSARCWVDGGAPALWPWQPVLRELCGDGVADLLASDLGNSGIDRERFARFVAVTEQLGGACARAPVCLIIDDVHAADAGALLLIRFLVRSLRSMPLVLVLTRRSGEPSSNRAPARARLLDDIERDATPVVLQQFDLHETNTFLATYGWADLDPDLVLTVLRVTGGNPLFLGRVAVLGLDDRQAALPGGVHVAIHEASARLDAGARRIMQVVAVLGLSPLVSEAAAVAETDPASVLDAVAEGTMAGLVTAEDPARFTFSHELVRSAFEHALPARERLDAHARAVLVVAGDERVLSPERSARSAHHALAAAPRSVGDARIAVSACRAAARSMVDSFAYEQADTLLSSAVDLHDAPGLGPAPAPLVVDWARAALLCGRLAEARVRFERAATVARREGDAVRLAEAALGLGGHWLNERRAPVERARVLALQRSALAGLPESHESLRCRLVTRLTAEAVYDGGPLEPVHQALAAARECGDPLALAEGLSLTHHTMLAPDLARDRLALANELIGVASESGHEFLALMGLCWRAVDLFLLGDGRAGRALEDLRERADALMSQNIVYIIEVLDVMRLIRAGRLDEAVAAAERCYELGIEVGEIDTLGYLCAHLLTIRWIQGRDSEVLELANEAATSPTLVRAEFGFKATAAALAARAGDIEPARAALDHLASGGLAALPRSSTWLPGMVAIVEVAAVLRDVAVAEEAYELLRPFSDLPVMPSLAVVCLGSTERALGMASLTAGHRDRAIAHLERAVAANRLLQNRPLVAITRAELAAALDQRRQGDDRARANELLEQAVLDAESMGMTARAAAWRRQLPQLAGGVLPEGPRADRADEPAPTDRPRTGLIRKQGGSWLLALDDRQVLVRDLVGLRYLAELLSHPGRAIPALTLATHGQLVGGSASYELLDGRARAAYTARIRELMDDLAEADANNDIGRTERVRVELDALVDQLGAATGLGGSSRAFVTEAERARTAVRKALKRAIDEIATADHLIGGLLRSSITTGSSCIYTPIADVTWSARLD